jgi:hypothetical protein
MDEFSFEHTHHLTEAEYLEIRSGDLGLRRGSQLTRRVGVWLVGVVCLLWTPSVLLGLAVLIIAGVHTFVPRLLPGTAARMYGNAKYLHEPITYGVDNARIWLHGHDFRPSLHGDT